MSFYELFGQFRRSLNSGLRVERHQWTLCIQTSRRLASRTKLAHRLEAFLLQSLARKKKKEEPRPIVIPWKLVSKLDNNTPGTTDA